MIEAIQKNRKLYHDNQQEFKNTFDAPLLDYWNNPFGFSIVKFDERLAPPDGTSLEDFIAEKFGEEAAQLIRNLLGMEN